MPPEMRSPSIWRRICWVMLALAVFWWQGPSLLRDFTAPPQPVDFVQEWLSARNFYTGRPIYSPHTDSLPTHLGREAPPDFFHFNAHPPGAVFLALPAGLFDYPAAFLIWNVISLVCFAACCAIVVHELRIYLGWWQIAVVVALLLVCSPFRQQVYQGQLNFAILLPLTIGWAARRRGWPNAAGIFFGIAACLKLFPCFLFVVYAWRREWRTVIAGITTFLALNIAALVVLGADAYRDYAGEVLPTLRQYEVNGFNMSLLGFWGKLFNPANDWPGELSGGVPFAIHDGRMLSFGDRLVPLWRSPVAARALGFLSAAGLTIALLWIVRPASGLDEDWVFGLAMTGMLLVSPITWDHYFLLLLVPLALLWTRLPPRGLERLLFRLAVFCLWLLTSWLFEWFVPGGKVAGIARPIHILTILSIQTYALLTLFVLQARAAQRSVAVRADF